MIWELVSGITSADDVTFSELFVYDRSDLAQTGTVTTSGLTGVTSMQANQLVGTSNGSVDCLDLAVDLSNTFTVTVDLVSA